MHVGQYLGDVAFNECDGGLWRELWLVVMELELELDDLRARA